MTTGRINQVAALPETAANCRSGAQPARKPEESISGIVLGSRTAGQVG